MLCANSDVRDDGDDDSGAIRKQTKLQSMLVNCIAQAVLPVVLGLALSTSPQCGQLPYHPGTTQADFVGSCGTR